jgi:hypothetical protein
MDFFDMTGRFSSSRWNCAISLAIFLASANMAAATSSEDAIALCETEMVEKRAALDIRETRVRRHDDVPYVYGTADFEDIKGLHFRCKVFMEEVKEVTYLVKDPEFVDGRAWATDRPQGAVHEGLELDEAALSAPPPVPESPHFVRVPQKP